MTKSVRAGQSAARGFNRAADWPAGLTDSAVSKRRIHSFCCVLLVLLLLLMFFVQRVRVEHAAVERHLGLVGHVTFTTIGHLEQKQ